MCILDSTLNIDEQGKVRNMKRNIDLRLGQNLEMMFPIE